MNLIPGVKVAVAADINADNLAAFQKEFDVRNGHADYRQMLEQQCPDVVAICTYVGLHARMIEDCARAGVKVICCEKPFVASPSELKRIGDVVAETGVTLGMAHIRRFHPAFVKARDLIQGGEIGMSVILCGGLGGWDLSEFGSHWIDLIRFLRDDMVVVYVMGQARVRDGRGYPPAMAKFQIALNMEFCRSADKSFEAGVRIASELGYRYVEPMVHTGWELLSEVDYFHSFSLEEDPLLMKEICDRYNIRVSSLSAHSPLMKPEAAVARLTRAAVLASFVGCDFLNSDEMIKPEWMDDDFAHSTMRYTLTKAALVAARHRKFLCIEPHGTYTKTAAGLLRIAGLVDSPWIQVNWDTGNSYLADVEDPYEGLAHVADRVFHIHAKDISVEHSSKEKGKVTGTPVGCACGEGVVDWKRVARILEPQDRVIFLSVECGTIDQAERSLGFLKRELAQWLIVD